MDDVREYSKASHITMNDVDYAGKTGVAQMMSIFQRAVTEHTRVLNVGANIMLSEHNAKWVITRVRFEIKKCLHIGDKYTVKTWPLKARPLRFGRSFVLESGGERAAVAYTDWCLIDADSGAALRSDTITMPIEEYLTDGVISGKFSSKRESFGEGDAVYTRKMAVSDLDINRHVNNISYIRLALDCFSSAELDALDINSFEMYYISQCFEGDTLTLYRKDGCIEARKGGTTVFRCTVNL